MDIDTILSIISIKYLSCHVVGGEACNKYLFTRNKFFYLLMLKIVQFLRGVFTTRSAAGICMNMSRVLACEVWECRVSGLQPQEMLFTMQS